MALADFTEGELSALRDIARRVLGGSVNLFTKGRPLGQTWEDLQSPEVYVAKTPAGGIPALVSGDTGTGTTSYDEPGSALCDIHCIDESDATPDLRDIGKDELAYNLSNAAIDGSSWIVACRDKFGRWLAIPTALGELYWGMLMEDHPGRGVCFNILLGQWCDEEYKFRFDCEADEGDYEVGIDWHYTVSAGGSIPEPEKYAQGWFKRMPAKWTDSGYVYVVVSLDCESDGVCQDHDIPCVTGQDPCDTGTGT